MKTIQVIAILIVAAFPLSLIMSSIGRMLRDGKMKK